MLVVLVGKGLIGIVVLTTGTVVLTTGVGVGVTIIGVGVTIGVGATVTASSGQSFLSG